MPHNEKQREGSGIYGCCGPMRHAHRSCGIMFGSMLILIGALWLAASTGWIAPELFWPVAFLAIGSIIVVLNLAGKRKSGADHSA